MPSTDLLPDPLPADPLPLLTRWLNEAWERRLQPNPNAMVLATAKDGYPSARVVLCKELVADPGYVVFYTNYHSRKGRELAANPRAAAVLHWDHLHRQVRIEGPVVLSPADESDAYFASRPWQSRVGAWASAQSEPIASREEMEAALASSARRLGVPDPGSPAAQEITDATIPRPPHWGGYRLWIETLELWVQGDARIHDRGRWSRPLVPRGEGGFEAGAWSAVRLQP